MALCRSSILELAIVSHLIEVMDEFVASPVLASAETRTTDPNDVEKPHGVGHDPAVSFMTADPASSGRTAIRLASVLRRPRLLH
jgi:hypothetical protein